MKSVAFSHFPRVVTGSNRFWLYNPILKKRYENRPEERVRLKFVEYILLQTEWKKSRIGFESPVKLRQRKNSLRADLVLYSDSMKPAVLVECKSHSVKLNHSAAKQAARYNSQIHAPSLVLTNGLEDFWFEQKNGDVSPIDNIFDEHIPFTNLKRDPEYWCQRGFCSSGGDPTVINWLTSALNTFWPGENKNDAQYLDFQKTVLPIPMNQYYRVFEMDEERRLAVGFIGHGSSDNFIVGILNLKGVNHAVLAVNLNKLQEQKSESVLLIKGNHQKADLSKKNLPIRFTGFDPDQIKNLPQTLIKFFD